MYESLKNPPFSIQIELTEGCNRGCNFCGLRGMRKKGTEPFYFMSKETITRIISEVSRVDWHSRIILSMHGEPTLNKNYIRIIKLIRKALPKTVISLMTNGQWAKAGDVLNTIEDIKDAGLNDLIIDMYTPNDDGHEILDILKHFKVEHNILSKGVPLYGSNPKKFRILFNPPIQTSEGAAINRHLCNHCGAAAPLDYSYKNKRCARPFREMTFRYDGSVVLCCNDFRGEYPIGNIMTESIEDIWSNELFEAARVMLYNGKRTFKPCLGCNALSHRVGLLPDKNGKESMPEVTKKIERIVRSIPNEPLCGDNFVKRPWEE